MDMPGIDGKPFKMVFDSKWFEKGDVIKFGVEMGVVDKVHKLPLSRWKRLLIKLGFRKMPIFTMYLSESYWYQIKPLKRGNNSKRSGSST